MIKYLGSKRTLIPDLVRIVSHFPELTSATDLFSGTCRVGHAFKKAGLTVHSNDLNTYAYALAMCYVGADRELVERDARMLIDEFNRMPGDPGYFTKAFCEDSRFFQPKNGARVDAIREAIERKELEPSLKYVLLVSLMEAADRVDSTCGVQMAYVKKWAQRSFNDIELRMPDVLPSTRGGACRATQLDAVEAAKQVSTDIVYLDPPYNQHSYLSNYHIWETLILWDKPEYYGVACKRIDCRTRKSDFNSRHGHGPAFGDVIRHAVRAPLVIVSFSDEGYQSRSHLEALLREHGDVHVIAKDFKRYVGAQIGIHNPEGKLVGEVSHLRNQEYIYLLATPGWEKSEVTRQRLLSLAESNHHSGRLFPDSTSPPLIRQHTAAEVSILTTLRERGGLSARDLEQATGLTSYRVASFLRSLTERGEVKVHPGSRLYYCVDCEPTDASLASVAKPSRVFAVAGRPPEHSNIDVAAVRAELRTGRGLAISELVLRTGIDIARVRAALRDLRAAGDIRTTGNKRGTLYWTSSVVQATAAADVATACETPVVATVEEHAHPRRGEVQATETRHGEGLTVGMATSRRVAGQLGLFEN